MKFIIISKKEKFNHELINDDILNSNNATSLKSFKCIKKSLANFILYLYPHNELYEEKEGIFYNLKDDEVSFINGLITCPDDYENKNNVEKYFQFIKSNKIILGDFQAINLKKDGNGVIVTSPSSIYPLFYYEDEYCSIISNELKLIVDGLSLFKKNKLVDFYDYEYIKEIFYYGDFYKGDEKTILRSTIFKNIKRILPHDEVTIKNGSFYIKKNDEIKIPKWFEEWYLEDKDSLFDWYFNELINYSTSILNNISENIKEINVPITGGFDSRLALMIFSIIQEKFNFKIISNTTGLSNHPDVELGEKVANALNIKWIHIIPNNLKVLPKNFNNYAYTFYKSQGDWNSYDFIQYSRQLSNDNTLIALGMDTFKRQKIIETINFNRWFSRIILSNSNVYFPLFSTNYELWFSKLYNKHTDNDYREFIYNTLKRGCPELLEIPFAFESLPQVEIEEYKNEEYKSTAHQVEPFLWDYNFVLDSLSPLFEKIFTKIDKKYNNLLSQSGINSLDYFLLIEDIEKLINKNLNDTKLTKKLEKLKNNSYYPKYRTYINLNNKNNFKIRALLKLMDYSAAANFNSFENLEKCCSFYENIDEENELFKLEEQYKKIGEVEEKYYKLYNEHQKYIKENKKLKKKIKQFENSNSWKITKPLRKLKQLKK